MSETFGFGSYEMFPGAFEFRLRDEVEAVLRKMFMTDDKDIESMIRISVFLLTDCAKATRPSAYETLSHVLHSHPASFKTVVNAMIDDTRKDSQMNEAFIQAMAMVMEKAGVKVGPLAIPEKPFQNADDFEVVSISDIISSGINAITKSIIPFNLIRQLIANRQAILSIDEFVSIVNESAGTMFMVGLAGLNISVVAITQLIAWWKGSITGARCIKEIIDVTFTLSAGVIGGMAVGAVGGSCAGPAGALVGGILGGLWTSQRANDFCQRMTQKLFGIPKSAALENAYKFFELDMTSTNEEINKAFRAKCLQHHPDKGGNSEDFIEVQLHMGVIKLDRGDLTA